MNLQKKSISVLLLLSFVTVSTVHAQDKTLANIGSLGFAISMIVDIVTAPASARSYNRELAKIGINYSRYGNQWAYTERHQFGKPEFRKHLLLKNETYFPSVLATQPHVKRKSESAAFSWSLGATVLPVVIGVTMNDHSRIGGGVGATVLFAAGFLVGPGVGHFYAHRPGRALLGIVLRVGFGILFINYLGADD